MINIMYFPSYPLRLIAPGVFGAYHDATMMIAASRVSRTLRTNLIPLPGAIIKCAHDHHDRDHD